MQLKNIDFTKMDNEQCGLCLDFTRHEHQLPSLDLECETCPSFSGHKERALISREHCVIDKKRETHSQAQESTCLQICRRSSCCHAYRESRHACSQADWWPSTKRLLPWEIKPRKCYQGKLLLSCVMKPFLDDPPQMYLGVREGHPRDVSRCVGHHHLV